MDKRPLPLAIACVLAVTFGAFKLFAVPATLLGVYGGSGAQPGVPQYALASLALGLSVVQVLSAIQLWRRRPRAWGVLVTVTAVGSVLGLGQAATGNFVALAGVAANVVILVLLLLPASRTWVRADAQP